MSRDNITYFKFSVVVIVFFHRNEDVSQIKVSVCRHLQYVYIPWFIRFIFISVYQSSSSLYVVVFR